MKQFAVFMGINIVTFAVYTHPGRQCVMSDVIHQERPPPTHFIRYKLYSILIDYNNCTTLVVAALVHTIALHHHRNTKTKCREQQPWTGQVQTLGTPNLVRQLIRDGLLRRCVMLVGHGTHFNSAIGRPRDHAKQPSPNSVRSSSARLPLPFNGHTTFSHCTLRCRGQYTGQSLHSRAIRI